jgi:iodotyrosine deiodinase
MKALRTVTLSPYPRYSVDEMTVRSDQFYEHLNHRRTVREFSNEPVPAAVISHCIRAAGTAPSGANRQPWHFVAVSNAQTKNAIRVAAEEEEKTFYEQRAPQTWLDALAPIGTDASKPFLDVAPWLIAVFAERHGVAQDGSHIKNYYTPESVGIATGFLLAALHNVGLATLTHTPSPMGFLRDILRRPNNERAYLLVVTGYPADNVQVPDIHRKSNSDLLTFIE